MLKFYKFSLIALLLCVSVFIILPNFFSINGKKINLGLDLRGGASLTLEIGLADYINEKLYNLANDIKDFANESGLIISELNIRSDNTLEIFLKDDQISSLHNILKKFNEISLSEKDGHFSISYSNSYLLNLSNNLIEESMTNLRKRIDEFSVKEVSIYSLGSDKIIVELPGVEDPEELKSLIGRTAKLSFHLIAKKRDLDKKVLPDKNGNKYFLEKKTVFGGEVLSEASVGFSQNGSPSINFRFNSDGARKFEKITKENIGKPLAIVLDDVVLTAPTISEPILNGRGEITGRFTMQEAKELAVVLKAGALPIKLRVIEQRIIGPTLGAQSMQSAEKACIISGILVCLFIIIAYLQYGLIASIALLMNFILILAILTLIQATLTLPGIAGLILTIGMAVDANVLIFEHMREEFIKTGVLRNSIFKGFERAKSTIFDANITTLVAAFVMLFMGSGPVKGFAVTLSIGIFTSIFTAVFVTKNLIEVFLLKK